MNPFTRSKLLLSDWSNRLKPERLRIPRALDEPDMVRIRRSILKKFSRRITRQDCWRA
jgi:hypothetical protein